MGGSIMISAVLKALDQPTRIVSKTDHVMSVDLKYFSDKVTRRYETMRAERLRTMKKHAIKKQADEYPEKLTIVYGEYGADEGMKNAIFPLGSPYRKRPT